MISPRRVLVLFEYASLNGGEMSFIAAAPWLISAGFELTAIVFEEGPLRACLEDASIAVSVRPLAPGATQEAKREMLANLFQAQRPSLIHANSLSMTRLSAPVAKLLGIPHLGYLRDIANVSRQVMQDLSHSDRLIAVSQAVKKWYEELGLAGKKIFVLHNGVDLRTFSPGERLGPLRAEVGLGDRPVVAGIGQLSLRKGFDIWLSAAELIACESPDCRFLIAGEQHSQKEETVQHVLELRRRCESGALSGKVLWLGRRTDIAQLLREADLLMHAARQEPLGRVLLEALGAGTPIVATRVGGTAEILPPQDHESALVDADDASALAARASWLLRSPDARAEIRKRYPLWAAEKFSAERSGAALAEHYRAVSEGAAGCND